MDLAELIDNATQRGYERNFAIDGDCLQCRDTGERATVEECRIVDTLAVDTGTDPGDDATIYLIDTRTGAKGYLVVSDSFHTDPARAAFVDRLVAHSGGT